MFLDFYNLREQPFGVTPDPRFLYFSPGHREALASLFYGIETGRGFLALIAEPGMGKTTLLYQLLDRMKDSVRHAFLFQTQCDSRDLLRYLLDGLGLNSCDGDFVRMHATLNEFLFRQAQAGRRVVLLIDEAQNLTDSVLETVRLLSDFEATDRKLLQIVLAGQPELAHRLMRPGLHQLRQRIAVLSHLRPLPRGEVIPYLNHRLRVAGYDGPELFTPGALALIAELGHGVPRIINNICFSALSLGCAAQCRKIGPEIVREALADLSLDSYAQPAVAEPTQPARVIRRMPSTRPTPSATLRSAMAYMRSLRPAVSAKRWFARAGLFAVALAILLSYFGQGGEGSPTDPALQGEAATLEVTPPTAARSATRSVEIQDDGGAPSQKAGQENSMTIHVVRRNDTLSRLCRKVLGRYDATVLEEIRELNWDLWDPDHIEVGQKIRLPRQSSNGPNASATRDKAEFQSRE